MAQGKQQLKLELSSIGSEIILTRTTDDRQISIS